MRKIRLLLVASIVLSILKIVPGVHAEPRPFSPFDVDRYLGTWNEIARLPVFYQRGCKHSQAIYARIDAENFSVRNTCDTGNRKTMIEGRAVENGSGRFKVTFRRFITFRAEYTVLWVERDYEMAVVVVPGKDRAWILSRTKNASPKLLKTALNVLKNNSYDVDELVWSNKAHNPRK